MARARIRALRTRPAGDAAWHEAIALAGIRLGFVLTTALDDAVRTVFASRPPEGVNTQPVRLALLSSATVTHLHAGLRVAGLRRGIWIDTYECDYGQYWQELSDPGSELHRFKPTAILFALDAHHLAAGIDAGMETREVDAVFASLAERLEGCWRLASEAFGCAIIQQTPLPLHPALLGANEHRLPGSRHAFIARLNAWLRGMTTTAGVDLLALDDAVARDGMAVWHDAGLWYRAKQEVSPVAGPRYGDLVGRILAAQQGRAFKCLVLDLDNTLWGGVVGDDGMDGIVLGQGIPLGEAFVALQDYAREQARRGVILAVCSKNDEVNAVQPFAEHPDMLLKRGDIVSFMANWDDKAANLRVIAHSLSIGLDAMVFVDDNPAERGLVRQELPMVAVPEIPDDPALVVPCLAAAGYFEGIAVTPDDRQRAHHYRDNIQREVMRAASGGLRVYLQNLDMELRWQRFDTTGLQRIVQLVNKTNQFNLTARRTSSDEVVALMDDPRAFGLQFRLLDRFGDNGIIGVVMGRMLDGTSDLVIQTWLMSCRVLGRGVERATFGVVAECAKALGARRLIGEYCPTPKNGMVREHYDRLGFCVIGTASDGTVRSELSFGETTAETAAPDIFIRVTESGER